MVCIKKNILYVIHNNLLFSLINILDQNLSKNECIAELPKSFIFGSVRGNIIGTLKTIMRDIYPTAIEFQFREPLPIQENMFPETSEESEDMNATRVELIDFSRPSDYRLRAVVAKKMGHSAAAGGDDTHLESSLSRGSLVPSQKTGVTSENPADDGNVKSSSLIKDSVSERWKELLTQKEIESEEARQKMRSMIVQKLPIRETLDIKMAQLSESIDW